jgi:putative ABC transport system permease protein
MLGINSQNLAMDNVQLTNGSTFTNSNEIILGRTAASGLNKTIGDELTISNQTFKIVGIYQTGDFMSDRGAIVSLTTLQNLTNTTGVSMILVKASNGTSADSLSSKIEQTYPNQLTTSKSLSGFNRMNNGIQTIESGSWAVTLIALLIGGVMVVATMMKSVSDRTREIGVLKAVGWDKRRILRLIIGESMILAAIGTFIGLIIGLGIAEVLTSSNILHGIQLAFSGNLLLRAVGVALFLGIVGGLYPAYRASRLSPTEALRYE